MSNGYCVQHDKIFDFPYKFLNKKKNWQRSLHTTEPKYMNMYMFVDILLTCILSNTCRKLDELEKELSEKHSLVLNKEKQDEQVSIQYHFSSAAYRLWLIDD